MKASLWLSLFAVLAASAPPARAGGNYGPADAEVLEVLSAINRNEIAAAELAIAKSTAPQVLNYAKMMEEDHQANLNEAQRLLKNAGPAPVDEAESADVKAKGEIELVALQPLEGSRFNAAYISMMVKGHGDALATIDKKLFPKARSKDVKTHLRDTRNRVAAHLAEARRVQSGLAY